MRAQMGDGRRTERSIVLGSEAARVSGSEGGLHEPVERCTSQAARTSQRPPALRSVTAKAARRRRSLPPAQMPSSRAEQPCFAVRPPRCAVRCSPAAARARGTHARRRGTEPKSACSTALRGREALVAASLEASRKEPQPTRARLHRAVRTSQAHAEPQCAPEACAVALSRADLNSLHRGSFPRS